MKKDEFYLNMTSRTWRFSVDSSHIKFINFKEFNKSIKNETVIYVLINAESSEHAVRIHSVNLTSIISETYVEYANVFSKEKIERLFAHKYINYVINIDET